MKSIASELLKYGIPTEAVVEFGTTPTPREVRYLDLFRLDDEVGSNSPLPSGVIESAARPAIYFKTNGGFGDTQMAPAAIQDLIRTLACRADAKYLALISPGVITVYLVGFFDGASSAATLFETSPGNLRLRNLIAGFDLPASKSGANSDSQWLEGHLFQLLKGAAKTIRLAAPKEVLSNEDVISLIGRALFTRFLADRNILKPSELGKVAPGANDAVQLFDTPENAAGTFRWLDNTFNGDLLHLSESNYDHFFNQLGDRASPICQTLGDIMWRAPGGQLPLDWGGLRFKHIPVDVLSQVYEHFAHENFPELAKQTSVHYTPRAIAELVVDGTFTALPAAQRADAKVLDAAAGAGVFLVLAFRRLVSELWLRQQRRPDRKQLRKIIDKQLCGMDINPESLKVAALSLYLAALELDPDPQPLSELKFDELFDSVLHCVSKNRLEGPDAHLGSLATGIPNIGKFDIVIGNPPWTVFPGSDKRFLDAIAENALRPHLPEGERLKTTNLVPRQAPDLAFLWKSLQWCKPGGSIGYLLDARLLFNADHFEARRLLFTFLRVTGILNATALRKVKQVWPSHNKPFCALVAINAKPKQTDSFYYLNPHAETVNSVRGEIRLDPSAAIPVPNELVTSNPYTLKTLFKGGSLDFSLINRLSAGLRVSFDSYVKNELNANAHLGYKPRGKKLIDASDLADLPSLEPDDDPVFQVDASQLRTVRTRYPALMMERPRQRAIYSGPLILFREAPKEEVEMRGAIWCAGDLAFSRSYYGLAITNQQIGNYLFVLSYSNLFVYWALLTSAKFGIERETFYLEDIRNFPIAPFANLSEELQTQCHELATEIRNGDCPWAELEDFVKAAYKLSTLDWQLITDAVTYASPYSQSLKQAEATLDHAATELIGFSEEMRASLEAMTDDVFVVRSISIASLKNWIFLEVAPESSANGAHKGIQPEASFWANKLTNEKSFWTSQLRLQIGINHWLIGQPDQARYWTKSKARSLALQFNEAGLFTSAER